MNRISYDLTDLGAPAHMPGWAKDLTVATQKVMDDQYLHGPGGLDNFYGQAEGWIQTQTTLRGSNPAYAAPPFAMAIPRRRMVTFDADGNMGSAFLPADPGIVLPALDPLPAVQPAPQPVFGGPHPPADPTQALAAIMAALMDIKQLLMDNRQRP